MSVDVVEEAAVVDPGDGGAAGVAEGVVLPPGGDLGGVVEVERVGAVLVGGDLEVVVGAGAGADGGGAAGQG